ncbi:response regulator [Anabaena azotica]|uniref:response regulator n=1 Tax=Anabaena azotica TaxID=197653 RepID=UPI0039A5BE05
MNVSQVINRFNNANSEEDTIDLDILKGFTIIVVDSDKDIVCLITEILEIYGIHVLKAWSAKSAFEIIKQSPVDLLISDITMLEEDGYWLIQKVRTLTLLQKREIPAIAFTGNAEDKEKKKALDSGFQTYIEKPGGVEVLVTEIAKLLKIAVQSSSL